MAEFMVAMAVITIGFAGGFWVLVTGDSLVSAIIVSLLGGVIGTLAVMIFGSFFLPVLYLISLTAGCIVGLIEVTKKYKE